MKNVCSMQEQAGNHTYSRFSYEKKEQSHLNATYIFGLYKTIITAIFTQSFPNSRELSSKLKKNFPAQLLNCELWPL